MAHWSATCLGCGDSVRLVYNRARIGDCPVCRCRRAAQAARSAARGEAMVRSNEEAAIGTMRASDWEPLEPYPGTRKPWKCRCLRCDLIGTPTHFGQARHRGCQGCGERPRITDASAEQVMRAAGWIPQGSYPGAREPWPCTCTECGRISVRRYETERSAKSGCQACSAGRRGAARREQFAQTAIRIMSEAQLKPLEPFPGSNKPWSCVCLRCGSATRPRYGNIASGGGGCEHCRRLKQGGTKRSNYAEAATARLQAAGYEPLEPYPGAATVWSCTCRCGRRTTIRIGNVDAGQRGCRWCAESGFSASKPAVVYLLRHDGLGALKIGITRVGSARLERFIRSGWVVVRQETFEDGAQAIRVEAEMLRWWRQDLGLSAHVRPALMPDGGWTETVGLDEISEIDAAEQLVADKRWR